MSYFSNSNSKIYVANIGIYVANIGIYVGNIQMKRTLIVCVGRPSHSPKKFGKLLSFC